MDTSTLGTYHAEEEQFQSDSVFADMHTPYGENDNMNMDNHIMLFPPHDSDGGAYKSTLFEWSNEVLDDCYGGTLVNERLLNYGLDMLQRNTPFDQLEYEPCNIIRDDNFHLDSTSLDINYTANDEIDRIITTEDLSSIKDTLSTLLCDSLPEEELITADMASVENKEKSPKYNKATEIHKKYEHCTRSRRSRPKSLSLPQSPEHNSLGLPDFPNSLCFEDLCAVNFDQLVDGDLNIMPAKVFDKALCISDAIDDVTECNDTKEIKFDFPTFSEDLPHSEDSRDSDTDDFIDVENVSDSESVPAIAANGIRSLLQQFEATENLNKTVKHINKISNSKNIKKTKLIEPKEPFVGLKIKKNEVGKSKEPKKIKAPSPSLKMDQENVHLDHDYCHASPIKNKPPERRGASKSNKKSLLQSKNTMCPTNDKSNSILKPIKSKTSTVSDHPYFIKDSSKQKNLIQNVIVLENGTERLIDISSNDSKDSVVKPTTNNHKTNNNSLLITNFNKCSDNLRKNSVKPKMVSLLKSSYPKDKNVMNNEKRENTSSNKDGIHVANLNLKETVKKKLDFQDYKIKKIDRTVKPTEEKLTITADLPKIPECKIFDPIALASKKALRMKKNLAQKYEDDLVMKRIRRVSNSMILPIDIENKLLPVKVPEEKEVCKINRDYIEIIMVSIGINTDFHESTYCPNKMENINEGVLYHGEDRTIIHVKDRKKPEVRSIGLQTNIILTDDEIVKEQLIAIENSLEHVFPGDSVEDRAPSPVHVIDKLEQTYMELINRWKTNSQRGESVSSRLSVSSMSSDKSYRKYSKFRRHRSSETTNKNQSKYKKRNRSYSRDRKRHRVTSSPETVNLCSKRKRNISITSNEINSKSRQPPNKIHKDKDPTLINAVGALSNDGYKFGPSRSRSISSCSNLSTDSSSSGSSPDSSDSISSRTSRRDRTSSTRQSRRTRAEVQEERKVIYVGMLEQDLTMSELKMKFIKYGSIKTITFHTKDDGMRYGFVTFAESSQTYQVLEKASTDPDLKDYDVFFGGRREFCKQTYADLDDIQTTVEESEHYPEMVSRSLAPRADNSFERLLKETKAALESKKLKSKRIYS